MKRPFPLFYLLVLILAACQQNDPNTTVAPEWATLTHPGVSLSGTYRLAVVVIDNDKDGNKVLSFQIQDTGGKSLYQPSDLFPTRAKTYFLWDARDRVWVYSSQLGTSFWQKEGESWVKHRYDPAVSSVPLPPPIKQDASVQH